jgi:hypothetical protein
MYDRIKRSNEGLMEPARTGTIGHENPNFLQDLKLDHPATPQLARFLLDADAAVRQRGIRLSFEPIMILAELNAEHFDTWGRFAPQLDSRIAPLTPGNSYCLVGRDAANVVVAVQAGRVYRTGTRTLTDICKDRSLYYGDLPPPTSDGITCTITCAGSELIRGCFAYSGGLWVHPNYRGHRLAALLPRVSRSYALGRFQTAFTFAFIGAQMAASPLRQMYGYPRLEPGYAFFDNGAPAYAGSLMYMSTRELLQDLDAFTSGGVMGEGRRDRLGSRDDHRLT